MSRNQWPLSGQLFKKSTNTSKWAHKQCVKRSQKFFNERTIPTIGVWSLKFKTMSERSPKEEAKRLRVNPEEYLLRKRLPKHLPKRAADVYVNMNTNFGVQMKKCQEILDNSTNTTDQLAIHGLGKAINRAINMALQLKVLPTNINHLQS